METTNENSDWHTHWWWHRNVKLGMQRKKSDEKKKLKRETAQMLIDATSNAMRMKWMDRWKINVIENMDHLSSHFSLASTHNWFAAIARLMRISSTKSNRSTILLRKYVIDFFSKIIQLNMRAIAAHISGCIWNRIRAEKKNCITITMNYDTKRFSYIFFFFVFFFRFDPLGVSAVHFIHTKDVTTKNEMHLADSSQATPKWS